MAEMARLGVDRATARTVLVAKTMPEFSNATDADLVEIAKVIQRAAASTSPKDIAEWYRTHPQWAEAQRQPPISDDAAGAPGSKAAASTVEGRGPGGGGSVETVRFSTTDVAVRRDQAIFKAVEACRSGLLAPAVALRDSLQACASFAAEVGQRVVCYSLVDSADLRTLRQLKPWLHAKGESGTREFDYVKRLVIGRESCRSVIASRSTVLYERNAVPLQALSVADLSFGPVRESPRERADRLRREEQPLVSSRNKPDSPSGVQGPHRRAQIGTGRLE